MKSKTSENNKVLIPKEGKKHEEEMACNWLDRSNDHKHGSMRRFIIHSI